MKHTLLGITLLLIMTLSACAYFNKTNVDTLSISKCYDVPGTLKWDKPNVIKILDSDSIGNWLYFKVLYFKTGKIEILALSETVDLSGYKEVECK